MGWLLIALSTATTILLIPGELLSWQIQAVTAICVATIIALAIDHRTQSLWSFVVVPVTLLILPIIFASQSQEPWIAYGLIVIPAIINTTAVDDFKIAIAIIYSLILLQYIVSKLDFASISDNVDNQLLSSYFATSWSFIVGFGVIVIRRVYLKYYDQIENSVEEIEKLHLQESLKISNLNLRDYLNTQLHGTVLNTLIAIKNSSNLLSDKDTVRKYLSNDLLLLEKNSQKSESDLELALKKDLEAPIYQGIDIDFNFAVESDLDPIIYELVREIIRELILNSKKHSAATKFSFSIQTKTRSLNEQIPTSINVQEISILFEDNSPSESRAQGIPHSADFTSDSIARLLRAVDGQISQESNDQILTQEITFRIPEKHNTFLNHIKTLRQESILFLSKGFILLTLIYAAVSFPGYLYLGMDNQIASLFLAQILLLSASFRFKSFALPLASLGSIISILIFPVLAFKTFQCEEIQYLPWVFNGILGSAFFVTLLVKSNYLKWAPIFLFLASNLVIQRKLPASCQNLLDGSIPAIIVIFFIAIGFMIARTRSEQAHRLFISSSMSTYLEYERATELVVRERGKMVSELKRFVNTLGTSSLTAKEIQQEISKLILLLRGFLLTSEYFNWPVVYRIYEYSTMRNLRGDETYLEIDTSEFKCNITSRDLVRLFQLIESATANRPVRVEVTEDQGLYIHIYIIGESDYKPQIMQRERLRVEITAEV